MPEPKQLTQKEFLKKDIHNRINEIRTSLNQLRSPLNLYWKSSDNQLYVNGVIGSIQQKLQEIKEQI